jgi:hypothetical protein
MIRPPVDVERRGKGARKDALSRRGLPDGPIPDSGGAGLHLHARGAGRSQTNSAPWIPWMDGWMDDDEITEDPPRPARLHVPLC